MSKPVRWAARACLAASSLALAAVAVPAASAAVVEPRAQVAPAARTVQASYAATPTAAAVGTGWIARDLSPSGAVVDAVAGKPSAGDTADAILALVAAGEGADQVRSAIYWLEHHFGSYVAAKGIDNPGSLGLVTLAAVAAGVDPVHFGGDARANDLVARLEATEASQGPSAGLFGTETSANAFSQSLALLALAAVKVPGKAISLGEAYLARLQCNDGGWEYSRTTVATPCAKPDPKSYAGPDTNSTALAVMAIVAVGGHLSYSAVAFFRNSQEPDGSFGYYGVPGDGQQGDPDSTAEVIQALIALAAVNDGQFVRGGVTPEQALERFQYGCSAPLKERGEFSYGGAPSQYATLQAVPAAAGATFPIYPRRLSVAEPQLSCAAG